MQNQRSRRCRRSGALIAVLALVLVIGCTVGGTIAWLVSRPEPIVNSFTYGDIEIELTETMPADRSATIIPGVNIGKDPKVTVKAKSEACWLFVKVEETGTFVEDKVTYAVRDEWSKGDGTDIPADVYYREVVASDAKAGISYYVLRGNGDCPNGVVNVSSALTKEDLAGISAENYPRLTFTAYAIQRAGIATAADAWSKISNRP